jgi:hypothetical protein
MSTSSRRGILQGLGRAATVQGAYGKRVGYISEETGKWGYLIVTPDGRCAVAYAEFQQPTRLRSSRRERSGLGLISGILGR